MNDKFWWYLSRSSGWVAFVLLALTVMWGIMGITKVIERKGLPRWMMDLHKYLALLSVVFTAIHLAGLVGDNFVHIGWREIMVPYAFDWKPGAVTFGIVAMYLIVAVQVTSWLRPHLPRKVWKATHLLSYPALWLVAMHGLRAGTDASNRAVRAAVMTVVGLTAVLTVLRIVKGRTARRTPLQVTPSTLVSEPALPEESAELDEPVPVALHHVHAAQVSLQDALRRVQATWPAPAPALPEQPSTIDGVAVDRRREARTLVDDVVPPS